MEIGREKLSGRLELRFRGGIKDVFRGGIWRLLEGLEDWEVFEGEELSGRFSLQGRQWLLRWCKFS